MSREIERLRATAVRWVSREPQPGLVEVQLIDRDGQSWSFIDKPPMFTARNELRSDTRYPVEVEIACSVIERDLDAIFVSTAEPHGIETPDGVSRFTVSPSQLSLSSAG
jgi:hypothetical protein